MPNSYFQFKQFTIHQDRCAMKVTTDGCLFGAFVSRELSSGKSKTKKVLDIGTGTGLLALMLAQQNQFSIDSIEIDTDAFEQASQNAAASPWGDRIKIFHGDANNFEFPGKYDVIISNPPFYENELKGDYSKKNIAHHDEGLLFTQLLSVIKSNLGSNGIFYILLPFKRNAEIRDLLIQNKLALHQLVFIKQSDNHGYFRIIITGGLSDKNQAAITIDELSVKNEKNQYTAEFITLLKEYYLYL